MANPYRGAVVLGYVPGPNTNFCVRYLSTTMQLQVHTLLVNTGGHDAAALRQAEEEALAHGALTHQTVDATQSYYDTLLRYFLFAHVQQPSGYCLSAVGATMMNALFMADHVRNTGADFVAHGSSGNGNHQVRYDMIFNVQLPGMQVLTPVRELKLTRRQVAQYMVEQGMAVDEAIRKRPLTYQRNCWGTTIGGPGFSSHTHWLPEADWDSQPQPGAQPLLISITFEKGEPVALNGEGYDQFAPLAAELQNLAAPYGIGRGVHIGDTVIGTKERFAFENPVATLLMAAHQALERQVLTAHQLQIKAQAGAHYARLVEAGQLLDPAVRDLEALLESSQRHVSGEVRLRLVPGGWELHRVKSQYDLLLLGQKADSDLNTTPGCDDIKGFAKIESHLSNLYFQVTERGKIEG